MGEGKEAIPFLLNVLPERKGQGAGDSCTRRVEGAGGA